MLVDFTKATHTAIISDLHLCEEEPVHPKFPLWKKYKTRQFFFDKEFSQFLKLIEERAQGHKVELVLNGDIFDFDSVMSLPKSPTFFLSWVERRRGMGAVEEKSLFKIEKILSDHAEWVQALKAFLLAGHKVVFVTGNHDLELHFPAVQEAIRRALDLPREISEQVRFCEWFYISNGDTLIEHGNQYDPYCMAEDPINPFFIRHNRIEVRVPFGNLATRYLINGMGFFNPHLDTMYIMTPKQYVIFFWRYMLRSQPLLMISWLWGSTAALIQALTDYLRPSIIDPLSIEDQIQKIADKSNATPRMVRELKELFVTPAASNPLVLMRELWLDRAFILFITFLFLYFVFLQVDRYINISFYWMFVPLTLFIPFFLFYSRSITSDVREFKEPKERILSLSALITGVSRICYGHTHIVRHEIIGAVEHLNSGTWSPAFLDVECERPLGQKTFIWIEPGETGQRDAKIYYLQNGKFYEVFASTGGKVDREQQESQTDPIKAV
jgi:UDP-2,3-diacylglucosamine pyrophosphatase LpxH